MIHIFLDITLASITFASTHLVLNQNSLVIISYIVDVSYFSFIANPCVLLQHRLMLALNIYLLSSKWNLTTHLRLCTMPRTQDWLQVATTAKSYWFKPWIQIPGIRFDIFLKIMEDFKKFSWCIVDLQCCISFRYTAKSQLHI